MAKSFNGAEERCLTNISARGKGSIGLTKTYRAFVFACLSVEDTIRWKSPEVAASSLPLRFRHRSTFREITMYVRRERRRRKIRTFSQFLLKSRDSESRRDHSKTVVILRFFSGRAASEEEFLTIRRDGAQAEMDQQRVRNREHVIC